MGFGRIIKAKRANQTAPIPSNAMSSPNRSDQTAWRRPAGVSVGTWRYVHEGSIADHYDAFVENTPLCRIDLLRVTTVFPGPSVSGAANELKPWILDLGCGTGRASAALDAAGYGVVAIDLSIPMLNQVLARRLNHVIPVRANLVELDCLADQTASGAVCLFSTLGMIQGRLNRRSFLKHVRRVVRPDAPFLLHVHHRYSAITHPAGRRQLIASRWRSWIRRNQEFGDAVYPYRGLPDMFLHQFSRRELSSDFKATGWRVRDWSRLSLDGSRLIGPGKIAGGFLITLV